MNFQVTGRDLALRLADMTGVTLLSLPFDGRWLARNSPARRVPSHGTNLMGERYAIDFIRVDDRRRTAKRRDWRTLFATEPAERFLAFGQPILAPVDGVVVGVHDGEVDHEGRRSQLTLLPYALGQAARLRQGPAALAGNHVVLALRHTGAFVVLAHLRAGSIRVHLGQEVTSGEHLADCGNSGNATQPHVHVQVMDHQDPAVAQGLPMAFRRFREWPRGASRFEVRESGLPAEGAVVEPLSVTANSRQGR
jgi:Peptidase family M23